MAVFPLFYAGNIAYYRSLLTCEQVSFERFEFFPKQTFRNRMEILGPNGLQKLVIPTIKTGERRRMGEVSISYAEQWQKDHWKGLEAAYRRSPYFEFYEAQFKPFYTQKDIESLWDFNIQIFLLIRELLTLEIPFDTTAAYDDEVSDDYRSHTFKTLENSLNPYLQVFSDRHPFHSNLSILDALFNLGPQAKELLIK